MIDLKPIVGATLAGDSQLVAALNGDHIYFFWPPANAKFPCVTYSESANEPIIGDGQEIAADVSVDINVWSRCDPSAIAVRVDSVMSANGWRRESSSDSISDDGALYNKTLRYRQILFVR